LRCRFPCAGPGCPCPLTGLGEGEEVAVGGVVADEGGVALADCRLVPAPNPRVAP
jgi:hypothetical protein